MPTLIEEVHSVVDWEYNGTIQSAIDNQDLKGIVKLFKSKERRLRFLKRRVGL